MSEEYTEIGDLIQGISKDLLSIPIAKDIFEACVNHRSFEIVELRYFSLKEDRVAEMLVVECTNDGVPTQNKVGILYRERLGLIFYAETSRMPGVRVLRKDFPPTIHQNYVVEKDEPASLCLYFDTWNIVRRTWTPQRYLNRILWWFAETAQDKLHREGDPVEAFYFCSPIEIVFPPDFDEKIQQNNFKLIISNAVGKKTYFGEFLETSPVTNNRSGLICIVLSLPPVTHGTIENFPLDLGTLDRQFTSRGSAVFDLLRDEIESMVGAEGVPKNDSNKILLILQIPIRRNSGKEVEKNEYKAFCTNTSLGQLGEACGVLADGGNNSYYKFHLLNRGSSSTDDWKSIDIEPIEILFSLTNTTARQASGISTQRHDFSGILAGVGALGSSLAEIWYREAWGSWTFIDPDRIKPHNLARHTSKHSQVGKFKANAVEEMVKYTYSQGYAKASSIVDSVTNWSNAELKTAVESADLVVDATTMLSVPRDLAIADIKRGVSVFLTPSGQGSVLLMEDSDRQVRLDGLEAQYYHAILNSDWGDKHLLKPQGYLWVGAGCSDISNVIPVELIQLHAATLARQIRFRAEKSEAIISIWHVDTDSGAIVANAIAAAKQLTVTIDRWNIVWNIDLQDKVRQMRSANLPKETGGILLGYFDLQLKSIFIVDILSAPSDSEGDSSGFTRGTEGLVDRVKIAQSRTNYIVSYVGEWHSHPPGISSNPSDLDITLLGYLADNLKHEGLPGVMLIVGENEETWLVKD